MEKGFYFIDGYQPDRTSKKLMRRHVMKGKNAGKKFHRASRRTLAINSHQLESTKVGGLDRRPSAGGISEAPSTVDKAFGDAILSSSLPMVEVSQSSLKIINQFFDLSTERLYPTTLGFSLCEAKILWLRLLFTDEAAYHCNVSLMQACNEIYLGNGSSTNKELYHLSQTFPQIQRKLESHDALSDSTMGLVISLIAQEQIRNQGPAAEVHARGLQTMVELRGGLSQINSNLTLVLKVCKTDIMLSLQYGRPTMFFRDHMAEVWNKLASRGCRLDLAPVIPCNSLNRYLYDILSDVMTICYLLNSDPNQPILDLLGFEEAFVSLCYRLLRFIPTNYSTGPIDSHSAYHLGLLIFIMTTFFRIGRSQIIDFKTLSLRFQDFLNRDLSKLEYSLSLWLMVIGGIWCSKDLNSDWVASRIRELAERGGIGSWSELRGCLCNFPWIQAIHDQPSHKLWKQVQNSP